MTLGLCCSQPACRPRPASLPIRVPTVESLLSASFGFTSRLRLAVHYGCRHRLRLAPFIQQDSAHAGHTGTGFSLWVAKARHSNISKIRALGRDLPSLDLSRCSSDLFQFCRAETPLIHWIAKPKMDRSQRVRGDGQPARKLFRCMGGGGSIELGAFCGCADIPC
jgi:hypothetical protein